MLLGVAKKLETKMGVSYIYIYTHTHRNIYKLYIIHIFTFKVIVLRV